ncbi:hypothetical protein [Pseudovibrio sp. Tun.PSC04-5.I4]|uniref:beta strand repeat-containing protein n=1 Tax=Pseudovibrio sp. Tun.PSC04-5.I4 TaxID=1798213 RepID=UPI000887AE47|nr:hypothetical protein [Pseudovibrio sp. Tun.PSC04-5.I4]SDR33823.1 hypothetical protein SAMN04515695_4661 [Pseudovibrio sp. Tun.PSC04-5.I4]
MSNYNPSSFGTDTSIVGQQDNDLVEEDRIEHNGVSSADVLNNDSLEQTVEVNQDAAVDAIAEAGNGIDDINGALAVGDDLTIDASSSASANGQGVALAFDQGLATGANQQSNDVSGGVTGGNFDASSIGGDGSGINAHQTGVGGFGNDTDTLVDVTQSNIATDIDSLENVTVTNIGSVTQDVDVTAGDADSGNGIVSGLPIGAGGAGGSVGDDENISGSTAAQADAVGLARSFNQTLQTGNNMQGNSVDLSITGSDVDASGAGGSGAAAVVGGADFTSGNSDTNTLSTVEQSNVLNDGVSSSFGGGNTDGAIDTPEVANFGGVEQEVTANAGDAESQDGISSATHIGTSGLVSGDGNVAGSSAASASASAVGVSFQQDITVGSNVQSNAASLDITGTGVGQATSGEDGATASVQVGVGIGPFLPESETDSTADFDQTNTAYDRDAVLKPDVANQGDLTQTISALGDTATAGDGIEMTGGALGATDVLDDSSVTGSTFAKADALGVAAGFEQNITTGGNAQGNASELNITGANQVTASAGEDGAIATLDASADTSVPFASGDHLTDTNTESNQSNRLGDRDTVRDADVRNHNDSTQEVTADGGRAEAGDGIYLDSGSSGTVGSNYELGGSADVSADAQGVAQSFNQSLTTGANSQGNSAEVSVTGAEMTAAVAGEDNAGDPLSVSLMGGNGDVDTNSDVSYSQENEMFEGDRLLNPAVVNRGGTEAEQTVTVVGGDATAGDGIEALGGNLGPLTVGDDSSISGSTSASADGMGAANAFSQTQKTGGNAQSNAVDVEIAGGNKALAVAGESGASTGSTAGTSADHETTTVSLGEQNNLLGDVDSIRQAKVTNNGDSSQNVDVDGGTASAGAGIIQSGSSSGEIGGNESISGSSSASADATAVAQSFTQTQLTGGNVQTNSAAVSVTGADVNIASAGEHNAAVDGVWAGTTNTNSLSGGLQSNTAYDNDTLRNSDVRNNDVSKQDVTAEGGSATAGDGIASIFAGQVGADGGPGVAEDSSISGLSNAGADAAAASSSFEQVISSGSNGQGNFYDTNIVGANSGTAVSGENNAELGQFGQAVAAGQSDTDTAAGAWQENLLGDQDTLLDADVINNGEVEQIVTATGGTATSGAGISVDDAAGDVGTSHVGDDSSITGITNASADASASASAMNQKLYSGGNVQSNDVNLSVTGGSSNVQSAGEDSDVVFASVTGSGPSGNGGIDSTNSLLGGYQSNTIYDGDTITDADVVNNTDDVYQEVTATGGTANAGYDGGGHTGGIDGADLNGAGDVGDNASVTGKALSSADATAEASVFNQVISTGGNTQVNSADVEIVGDNKNVISVGDDSSNTATNSIRTGTVAGNADSLALFSQTNTAGDVDLINQADVENFGDFEQTVSAYGGEANSGDGIADHSGNSSSVGGDVGDDYTVTAEVVASADATATASAFNQNLYSGGNKQVNSTELDVTGQNDTFLFTGEDDGLGALDITPTGTPDPISGGPFGVLDANGTDTIYGVEQANALYDQDTITNVGVHNQGEFTQTVTAEGGESFAGDGIYDAENIYDFGTGDDYSVTASTAATADALGVANAFNQTIVMGANVQANAVDVNVVGGSSTVNVVGEDDLA